MGNNASHVSVYTKQIFVFDWKSGLGNIYFTLVFSFFFLVFDWESVVGNIFISMDDSFHLFLPARTRKLMTSPSVGLSLETKLQNLPSKLKAAGSYSLKVRTARKLHP